MLKDYFEQIQNQLKADISALAQQYPDLAINLQRHNTDPDVARLLEGVALMAARQLEHLDHDHEEYAQGWLQSVAPDLLKPSPAMGIAVVDTPAAHKTVNVGHPFFAMHNDVRTHWRCAQTTSLLPVSIASTSQTSQSLTIDFDVSGAWVWHDHALHLQWLADENTGLAAIKSLLQACTGVSLNVAEKSYTLDRDELQLVNPVMHGSWQAQIQDRFDHPKIPTWLKECFCYPLRFLAISLPIPEQHIELQTGDAFTLTFQLDNALDTQISADCFTTNAIPLINVKDIPLLPFVRKPDQTLYELSPVDRADSLDQLMALTSVQESIENRVVHYAGLHSTASAGQDRAVYQLLHKETLPHYQLRLARNSDNGGLVKVTALVHEADAVSQIQAGDPVESDEVIGSFAQPPSSLIHPLTNQDAHWQAWQIQRMADIPVSADFLRHLLPLLSPPNLPSFYEHHRRVHQFIDAIQSVDKTESPITRGTGLILGQKLQLTLDFTLLNTTDAWWQCQLLWLWFRSLLPVNSVLEFAVFNDKQERVFYWPHASGSKAVV